MPLAAVESVQRSVAVIPLPKAPEIALGVFSLRGALVPVLDLRKRFGLPASEIGLSDCFVVARTVRRRVALLADSTLGVLEDPGPAVSPKDIMPGLELLKGIKRAGPDIILIYDLDALLSLDEEASLSEALPAWR